MRNLVSLLLICSSCALFTPPESKPILTDQLASGQVVATTADRRAIYADNQGLIVCEPPPDAFQEVSSKFDLAAALQSTADAGSANLALYDEVSRRLQRLAVRSQGVIFFRDASFRLAEAALNERVHRRNGDATKWAAEVTYAVPSAKEPPSGAFEDASAGPPDALTKRSRGVVQVQSAVTKWDDHFSHLLAAAERLIIFELEHNPQLNHEAEGSAVPDLMQQTGPNPVVAGEKVVVYFLDPARAGKAVTVKASSTLGQEPVPIELSLDAHGFGVQDFQVPKDWPRVYLEADGSLTKFIRVKKQ